MNLLIVAAVAALAAQSAHSPTPAQFAQARQMLDEKMLDYPSARFRDVHADELVICGFVNAKNRMGAYTGWKRFAAWVGENPSIYSDEAGESDDIMIDAFCGDDGRRLTGTDYSDRIRSR